MSDNIQSKITHALLAGFAGAAAVTVIHETARHLLPHPPRVDVIGSRAIAASYRAAGVLPPPRNKLYVMALLADVLSNGAIYAIIPLGNRNTIYRRGLLVGVLAGLSALVLPKALKLGKQPGQRTPYTQTLTMAWYTIGGLIAAAVGAKI